MPLMQTNVSNILRPKTLYSLNKRIDDNLCPLLGRFEKSVGKQKFVLKDGNVVDPECEVADVTHIYKQGTDVYSVVLSKVDLSRIILQRAQ